MRNETGEDVEDVLPWQLGTFLSVYFIFAMIFCLFSNVMVADYLKKCRHVFLKMDPVSLHCLDNLAISDLIFQIFRIFPMATTSIAGRWVFGSKLCFLNSIVKYAPVSASLYHLVAITLLQVCKVGRSEEFVSSRATPQRARLLAVCLWLLACLSSVLLVVRDLDYFYQPWNMGCEVADQSSNTKLAILVTTFGLPLLLLVALVATLIFLCCMCCPNSFDSRAILIVEVSVLFICTTCPSVGLKLFRKYGGLPPDWAGTLDSTLYTVYVCLRPILYTTVSRPFKDHVVNVLCCGRRRVGGEADSQTLFGNT